MRDEYKKRISEMFINEDEFLNNFSNFMHIDFGKDMAESDMIEKYIVLSKMLRTYMLDEWRETKYKVRSNNSKQVYYFSLEFLLGRMLKNNLKSLGVYDVVKNGLSRMNIDINDIEAACFGLAGCDVPYQHEELVKIVSRLGFKNFVVVNDSLIPVKAGTTKGYGACSICGTGTSSSGIGIDQEVLQVGGIGSVTGDEAGGRALARLVVTAAYSEEFRAGEKTSLTKIVKDALGVTDKKMFMQKIVDVFYKRGFDYNQFTVACFEEANKGDKVALNILVDLAEGLAHSVSGTVLNLKLDEHDNKLTEILVSFNNYLQLNEKTSSIIGDMQKLVEKEGVNLENIISEWNSQMDEEDGNEKIEKLRTFLSYLSLLAVMQP